MRTFSKKWSLKRNTTESVLAKQSKKHILKKNYLGQVIKILIFVKQTLNEKH